MCWLRKTNESGGWFTVGKVLMVLMLAIGLAGLVAPPASAYSGPYPIIQVAVSEGPDQIIGWGWSEDDNVTITRIRESVSTPVATVPLGTALWGPDSFQYFTSGDVLAFGDTVTVTGDTSSYGRLVTVVLDITHFDVANATLSGVKGRESDGWGPVRVNTGTMFSGGTAEEIIPADDLTTWETTTLDSTYFALMAGTGASAWQFDPDGDTLQVTRQVPNPEIRIEGHGVSMRGWMRNSTLQVSLDTDADHSGGWPYQYTVTTDSNGNYCCQPAPDAAWQVMQPGWTARVVGSYPERDAGTVTKEVQFADLPIPTVSGNVISGLVPGPLTATTVGRGSLVEAMATCPSMGTNPVNRSDLADESTGGYTVDFGAVATQPWGWGGPCTDLLYYYGANVNDLDGDEVHFNWFVDSKFDATHPSLTADSPVTDGAEFGIEGTGWDLTAMRIQQCAMDGDVVGECDPTTTQFVTSYPDTGWPTGMARLDPSVYAKQVLELSGGTVDCAEAPGTCAVKVTEAYRPDISAFAPLTYEVPYWVDLGVTVDPAGTIVKASGAAVLSGTVSASESTGVHLYGELYQRLGRKVVSGGFDMWVYVEDPAQPVTWTATIHAWNGLAYGAGSAQVTVYADLGDEGPTDGAMDSTIVRLVVPKAPRPPRR